MQDRIPPQDIEAEQAVLGAMLIDEDAAGRVLEKLRAEDFYREAHRVIFAAMEELHAKKQPIDMLTLTDVLKKNNHLDDVGGIAYVTSLANVVPTAANVDSHADIVEEKSTLRQLIAGGTTIVNLGFEGKQEIREIIDEAESKILSISNRKREEDFVPMEKLVPPVVDRIAALAEHKGALTGLATGFVDFDNLTAGLHPSDFIILAARPSMGKTALALNIIANVAIRGALKKGEKPKSVALFSLEMSREQLVQRMMCSEATVDAQALRLGKLNDGDWTNIWNAADKLSGAKIYINDTPGISVMEMRSKARRLQSQVGLDLLVVDYLQLMQGSNKKSYQDNRQQEVSDISRNLKSLARELNVPVLALSQLSRGVESRQVKKPMLSDLRESGSLEQDADIVAFLYREDYYKQEDEQPNNVTELIVAKHRNGPVGTIHLYFDNKVTTFRSLAKPPVVHKS
jgi:replicative DNA helicase